MASDTALGKRSSSHALMAPPPARPKRIKRPSVVLDEDTYTSAVSHIIRRDFFPGLAEANAQREYLDAVESHDKAWIREAGRTLTQIMTPAPGARPQAAVRAETVVSQAEEELGTLDPVDLNLSLGAFQAKYISDDQESFSQIVDKQNRTRFEKTQWVRQGNMYASKQRVAQQKILAARAAASSHHTAAVVSRPSQDLDDRPAAPTYHKHTAFNSLMFGPDSVENWAPTRAQRAEDASLAPPKRVVYNNTRLPVPEAEPPRPSSPTLSTVRDAVAGRPRLNPSEGGYSGNETPRVNGYAFVDAHPPDTDNDSDDDDAPTDLLSKFGVNSRSKATPFTIRDASAREKLHHKMVDKITTARSHSSNNNNNNKNSNNNNNTLAKNTIGSGLGIFPSETPRFLSAPTPAQRLSTAHTPARKAKQDLTPAAQRLFANMGGATPRAPRPGGFGSGLAGEWTPVSRRQRARKDGK